MQHLYIAPLLAAAAGAQPGLRSRLFWSSDFHISPIKDAKLVLKSQGHRVLDQSLSGRPRGRRGSLTPLLDARRAEAE